MSRTAERQESRTFRMGGSQWTFMRTGLAMLVIAFLAIGSLPGAVTHAAGDELVRGHVTAVTDTEIQVDGTSYPVSPDVTIQDERGRARGWQDVKVRREVSLRLAGGTVELIIVTLYD